MTRSSSTIPALMLCLLVSIAAFQPALAALDPQQATPKLRRPWPERAAELGVQAGGVWVQSDLSPRLNQQVIRTVEQTRRAFERLFDGIPLQKPEAPWILLFEDPAEMGFVTRGDYGIKLDTEKVLFFEAPFQNRQVIVATSQQPSGYGGDRALQRAALKQYALPRFGDDLPAWALVGLAEYASLLQFSEGRIETGYVPPEFVQALRKAESRERLLPVKSLLTLDAESWADFEATHGTERLTAQAWALVHFMLHGRDGSLARPFSIWLHRTAAGTDPTTSFNEVLQIADNPAGMTQLEEAFRAYHRTLEPSSAVELREGAEFCRAVLEHLERQQLRPSSRRMFLDELSLWGPQEVILFNKPYSRVLSKRDTEVLENLTIEFVPTRLQRKELDRLETLPPLDLLLTDAAGKSIRVTWRFDSGESRWVPLIEW